MQNDRIDPNDPALDTTIRARVASDMAKGILAGRVADCHEGPPWSYDDHVVRRAVEIADALIAALNAGGSDE